MFTALEVRLCTVGRVRICVVDDEEGIRSVVVMALEAAGFTCSEASSGAEALLLAPDVDIFILDWMLPDLPGIEVARALKQQSHAARVLFLTARTSLEDKLVGLDLAADYLTKPFEIAELVARVKNLATQPAKHSDKIIIGQLTIDRGLCKAFFITDEIPLTPTEFRLLEALAEMGGTVLSRADAYEVVWGYDFGGSRANLDTLASSLRKKLQSQGCEALETVRGFGYRLQA
jgi:DNA-binding response OmpR family regulator